MRKTSFFDELPVLFDELHLERLSDDKKALLEQIDALLPQTQCGLCGYRDGCLPYAHAIVTKQEAIHLCVPGGDETARAIATLTHRPILPATPSKWAIDSQKNRPIAMRAIIDEDSCIGCTKCIPACPVDAIIGTAKHMHSVIESLCTGCELCLPPCPVDCISLVPNTNDLSDTKAFRQRYHAHLNRSAKRLSGGDGAPVVSHSQSKLASMVAGDTTAINQQTAQQTIAQAKLRSQIKKLTKQLAARPDSAKQAELDHLIQTLHSLTQ